MFNQSEIDTLILHRQYCERGLIGFALDTGGVEIQSIYSIYKKYVGSVMLTCAPCVFDMIKYIYNKLDKQIKN